MPISHRLWKKKRLKREESYGWVPRDSSRGWQGLATPPTPPGWEKIKHGTGRGWHRPGLSGGCCFANCLPVSLTHRLSCSLTLLMRNLISWSRKKIFWGGGKSPIPNAKAEDQKQQGDQSQVSDPRVKGMQTRWGFKSLPNEKHPSHSVNSQTRFSRFRTFSSII